MTYYIYFYYEEGHAEPFYVGKGCGHRAWDHLYPYYLNQNDRFHNKLRALLRDGFKPEIIIQDQDLTESEAFNLERIYIKHFGRTDLSTGRLCNCTDGGDGTSGSIRSEQYKQKKSSENKGKLASKEAKLNMSLAHGGKPIIAKWKINGLFYKRFLTLNQVKDNGFTPSYVCNALKGRVPQAYGLIWEYEI